MTERSDDLWREWITLVRDRLDGVIDRKPSRTANGDIEYAYEYGFLKASIQIAAADLDRIIVSDAQAYEPAEDDHYDKEAERDYVARKVQ